jgi:glycosyltransferase involved in cell wall biosynthesis
MKVTIFTSAHPPDDKRIFQRQARYLAEKGLNVVLIAPGLEGRRMESGVQFIGLGPHVGYRGRVLRLRKTFRLARATDAEVYHFHDPDLLPVGIGLKRSTGSPVVYDCHENYRLAALSSRGLPPWLAPGASQAVDLVERTLARRMSAVVSPHPQRLKELVGGSGVASLQVPNSPRKSYGGSSRSRRKAQPPEVVYIGLLSEERGADLILEAARLLPELRFRLHVDLGGPERLADYQVEVERMGLTNVQAEGYVPYGEVAEVLSRATVGLLPWMVTPQHLYAAQPTKLFEYMAVGLPIVAADLPITRQIVEESGAGILHTPGDADDLARKIQSLVDSPVDRASMSKAGRRSFHERYNFDAVGEQLLDLYERLAMAAGPKLRGVR